MADPQRIWVIGCPGSGKSTLSRQLAEHYDLPRHELDALFHQPGWTQTPDDEFRAQVVEITSTDRWVLDGNYYIRTGNQPKERVELVVWIDLERFLTVRRVFVRTMRRLVRREVLWNGNREPWYGFLDPRPAENITLWAWRQHPVYRRRYGEAIANQEFGDATVVRLRSPQDVWTWLAGLA